MYVVRRNTHQVETRRDPNDRLKLCLDPSRRSYYFANVIKMRFISIWHIFINNNIDNFTIRLNTCVGACPEDISSPVSTTLQKIEAHYIVPVLVLFYQHRVRWHTVPSRESQQSQVGREDGFVGRVN